MAQKVLRKDDIIEYVSLEFETLKEFFSSLDLKNTLKTFSLLEDIFQTELEQLYKNKKR